MARRHTGAALAILAGSLACGPAPAPEPASVLLVTVDTLRPDYLSANGYDLPTSPAIDALIAEGFYFEEALAPVPRTTPALAALLTGAHPHANGVRRLTDSLDSQVVTLAEVLAARGYQTLAVVSNQVLSRSRGLDRGFDVYDAAGDTRDAAATTEAVLRRLPGLRPGAPAFLWVHYIDPHMPYHPEREHALAFDPDYRGRYRLNFGRRAGPDGAHRSFPEDLPKGVATHANPLDDATNAHIRRLYAADIRSLDDAVGRLVAGVRASGDHEWIVAFTADHGESLGEHDFFWDHGDYVYNAGTRVPLAFVLPPSHPLHGTGRCRGWVSLIDVAPTLLELLGGPVPRPLQTQMDGRSLAACLRGEALGARPVFAESGYSFYFDRVKRRQRNDVAGRLRSVTHGEWKLIWTPFAPDAEAWELYHVARDPHETENLYRPDHPTVAQLKPQLLAWAARSRSDETGSTLDPADAAALRELGYLE